ncbi:MAG: response regulator [Candidatus Omnitrophota bacterium]|nr:response regulator [Candidatus Omnitrophota bacterium]
MDILLVEDNEADIKITLRAFGKAKIKNNISIVRDGQESLSYMFRQNEYADRPQFSYPDMIVLDISLPKLTGFEVLEALKKDDKLKVIPVVMLTSSKDDEDIIRSYRDGAVSFIQKPVDYQEFEKTVDGFNLYWHTLNKLPKLK